MSQSYCQLGVNILYVERMGLFHLTMSLGKEQNEKEQLLMYLQDPRPAFAWAWRLFRIIVSSREIQCRDGKLCLPVCQDISRS